MTSGSPPGPHSRSTGIGDHQLGQRLGVLIAQQAASSLPFSAIFSQLQDLLGADTAMLGPLRDLLGRPGFRQLTGLDQGSVLVGGRDALLQELALTYNAAMVSRLAAVIDGCLGLPPAPVPAAVSAGAWGAAPPPPPPPPPCAPPALTLSNSSPPWSAPASASPHGGPPPPSSSSPPQAQPPPAIPVAAAGPGTVTALLIALVSMLSGAVLLGLGWLLFGERPLPATAPAPAPAAAKAPRSEPPAPPPRAEPPAPVTPKEPASEAPPASTGAWGSASDYKFGQLPGETYPNSCAFSQTDPSGRVTTSNKSQLEFWACRDVGGDAETGYRVIWADGKETTYTFGPDGDGQVVGTNGSSHPMRWRNDSHQGDPIVVINHQDGAISWIPGNIN